MNKKKIALSFIFSLVGGGVCIAMDPPQPGQAKEKAAADNPAANTDDTEETIKNLREELKKAQAKATYHTDIHANVGQAGPLTDAEMAAYYKVQTSNQKSIINHPGFQIGSTILDTTVNKIAAPIFVEIAKPAFSELWQKKVYQTAGQALQEETNKLSKEMLELDKDAKADDKEFTKRLRSLEMQNKLLDNWNKHCANASNDKTCDEMEKLLETTHKKFIIDFYEQITGKKYMPPKDRSL